MAQFVGDDIQRVGEKVKADVVAIAENHPLRFTIPEGVVVSFWSVAQVEMNAANKRQASAIKGVAAEDLRKKVMRDFESVVDIVDLAVPNAHLSFRSDKSSREIVGSIAIIDLSLHGAWRCSSFCHQSLLNYLDSAIAQRKFLVMKPLPASGGLT